VKSYFWDKALPFVASALVVLVLFSLVVRLNRDARSNCEALTARAAISKRAAEICTGELVGCSLSFEQVERIVAEQEAARGCK
jgi:hypothetical protein